MKIRKMPIIPVKRRETERLVQTFTGLNTTAPYTQMKDSVSPNFYNCRLYARNSTDRRVAVGTRKGPGFYTVPLGETVDQQITSTTGAVNQSITTAAWIGQKFTAGANGRLTKVDINIKNGTTPTQHMIVCIYSDSGGSPNAVLGTSSILSTNITASLQYLSARFVEAPQVASGTSYWVVAYMQAGGSGSYNWSSTTSATTAKTSTNSGGSWSATTYAMNVKTYVSTNSKLLGGSRYTPSNATAKTFIAHGTSVYSITEGTGATTAIKTGLSSSATDYYFDQSNDQLFYVNGYDAPRFWNGTTDAVVAGSPPTSKFVIFHKNRAWFVDAANPTKMVFSELGDYQQYLSTSFIYAPSPKSGDPIVGWVVFQDNLVVFTRKTKYTLFGDDPGNFVLRQSSGRKGAVNQDVIKADANYIYFLSDDGVYRYNGSADELMSDSIQTEIDSMADKTTSSAAIQNNYYRLYYKSATGTTSDSCILWDTLNNFWLRDSGTYITKPFVNESNVLYEGSSLVGALYLAEQAYSDLGKPIAFIYWTKYFGDGIRKILLRRLIPSIRLQTQPYNLNIYIDIDLRNTIPLRYTIDAQASGYLWGQGAPANWGAGSPILWGSNTVSTPTVLRGTEAFWHQIRFEQTGVDTPVEILSYVLELRVRRTE
jgi:hypothetical protein